MSSDTAVAWNALTHRCVKNGLPVPVMKPDSMGWDIRIGTLGGAFDADPERVIAKAGYFVDGWEAQRKYVNRAYNTAELEDPCPPCFYDAIIYAYDHVQTVISGAGTGGPTDHHKLALAVDALCQAMLTMPKPGKRSNAEKSEIFSKLYGG